MKLGDILNQGGKLLSADELRTLLTGAKARSEAKKTIRDWENNADGKLVASSVSGPPRQFKVQALGNWNIDDNGMYCVHLEWPTVTEKWCRYVFKLGDKHYLFSSATNKAGYAWEFEFSR